MCKSDEIETLPDDEELKGMGVTRTPSEKKNKIGYVAGGGSAKQSKKRITCLRCVSWDMHICTYTNQEE
jgi:hypothetical protein